MSDAESAGAGLALMLLVLGIVWAVFPLLNIAFLSGIRSELKALNKRIDTLSAGRASSRAAGSHPQPHCSEPPPAAPRRSE